MIILIFIGFIFIVVGIALIVAKDDSPRNYLAILLITFGIMFLHEYALETSPQAIDVYRGRTTLEITYKDSIPIDSVVVFKE